MNGSIPAEQIPLPSGPLEERIGHRFTCPALLLAALTHRSFLNEHPDRAGEDNQRLEFLGDAVVQLVVSEALMDEFVGEPEGQLTKMRARVVSMEALAEVAHRLELGRFMLLGRGEERSGGRTKDSLLADAFEALAGALLQDSDFPTARAVLLPLLRPLVDRLEGSRSLLDGKSRLQELTQSRFACVPQYAVVGEEGPDHAKAFRVQVTLAGHVWGVGLGGTKKAAEQAAAALALQGLEQSPGGRSHSLADPPPLETLEQAARERHK